MIKKFIISDYIDILALIMALFMADALIAIIIDIVAVTSNGELKKQHSNKLMRLRVLLQTIAIVFFVIIVWLSRN